MKIALLQTAIYLSQLFEHDKATPFNSDHVDFGKNLAEGFMMNTNRGMVVVGTDKDEMNINVMVIHLGTGDKETWENFDDVYMGQEIVDWLDRKDKDMQRKDRKLPPACMLMKF